MRTTSNVRAARDEANRCLSALRAIGRSGDGPGPDALGFVGLLLGDDRDVGGFVGRVLGPVVDYDRIRGTELVGTLEVQLALRLLRLGPAS